MSKSIYYDENGKDITDEYFKAEASNPIFKSEASPAYSNSSKAVFYKNDKVVSTFDSDPKMSCRETILEEAKRCICVDRQNQYGAPEDSFELIADFWNSYLFAKNYDDPQIKPSDVANMMILLKVARTKGHKGHNDNYVDISGYAALAAELSTKELT